MSVASQLDSISADFSSAALNEKQEAVFQETRLQFVEFLADRGKNPKREIGYAPRTISERVSRLGVIARWVWDNHEVTTEIEPRHGDAVIEALDSDTFRTREGDRFSESSKRKMSNVLQNWFTFRGRDWEPEIAFSDNTAKHNADPFSKPELERLYQASLTFKTIPSYNNLTPDERDRWKAHLAQELGKPKDEVRPADWEKVNRNWKIPSIIQTVRQAGWRPALIKRLRVDWYDETEGVIEIPQGKAVKNDASWTQELTPKATNALDRWLEQRANMERYDGRPEMWLNRKGNPYDSGPLNRLLRQLMEEADIQQRERNLVWYSFRHSIGTYVYEEYTDLKIVADVLRQKSTASASHYIHTPPELKREAASIM